MRRLVEQLFGAMPREFASPQRRTVETTDELIACIDEHNGLTDCFVTAYAFNSDERSYSDVVINKAVFDFDDAWTELQRAHDWLEERDVAHVVTFSGSDRSGHVYILTEPTTHQPSLEYFQRDIVIDGAGLRKCRSCDGAVDRDNASLVASYRCDRCDSRYSENETRLVVDSNLVGEPTTHIRVPNTWNPGAERFCIPLRPDEVHLDMDDIYDLAKSQRDLELADAVSGQKTPAIDQHAETAEEHYHAYDEKRRLAGFESDQGVLEEFEAEVTPKEMLNDVDCECLLSLITDANGRRTKPDMGHRNRRVLVSYLVERGYNPEEIAKFLRFVLSEDKARHSVVEEEQPVRIWRDGVKAPNKVTLKRMGLFQQSCPEHAKTAAEVIE